MDPNRHVGNNSPPNRSQPAPPADNPTAPVLIPQPRRFRGAGTSVHHGNYNPPAFLSPAPQSAYFSQDQLSPRGNRREEHSDVSDHSTPTSLFHMDISDEGENVEVQAGRQAVHQEAHRAVYAADTGEGSTSAASVVNTVNANSGEGSTPAASVANTVNANSRNPVKGDSQEKGSSSTAVSQNKDSSAIAASQKKDSSPIATSDIKGEGSTSAASVVNIVNANSGNPVKADSQEKGSSSTAVSQNKDSSAIAASQKKDSSPIATSDIKGEGSTSAASVVNTVNTNSGNPAKADSQEKGSSSTAVSQKKDSSAIAASQKKDRSPIATSDIKGADRDPDKDRKKDVPSPRMQFDDENRVKKAKKRSVLKQTEARNRVELFRHLPQYEHGTQLTYLESKFFQLDKIHPAVYKVGLRYLAGDISGGNARCIAMLQAFRESIKDYTAPPKKAFTSTLTTKINSYVSFLIECRPLSISMANAIRFLKTRITKLSMDLSDVEAKASLISDIDSFISDKIILADEEIVNHAVTKIKDGDVLLTYTSSSAVEMLLVHAHELGKKFRVVIIDSRPKFEGRMLLRRLVGKGISCTYTHINAISYIMHEATRVFLGASSVLSNGTVYSRVGTASVAMVAHQFHIPVLMCCEAYKFHERVQLDSICFNELGDPDVISKVSGRKEINYLDGWANSENLQLLNLIYDVTPSDYVSLIISDCGMIPTTSVPVIVHEYRRGKLWTERYMH